MNPITYVYYNYYSVQYILSNKIPNIPTKLVTFRTRKLSTASF